MREYRELLADLPVDVTYLDEVGITTEVAEAGESFAENAVLKALGYAEMTGLWTWADDSGLEVDVLGGEPGIYSARYGGLQGEQERYNYLLARLADVPDAQRAARFRCVVALAFPDGDAFTASGAIEGTIAHAPRGSNGFGYDPLFWVAEQQCSSAELTPAEKNQLSYRARAMALLKQRLGLA